MKRTAVVVLLAVSAMFWSCKPKTIQSDELPQLKVSENQRYLQTADGDPFFWLGDTGWLLFTKLNREETETYLNDRVEKGYNVIQVMVLHTLAACNYYGDSALINSNVSTPMVTEGSSFADSLQYDYWDHVDYVIDLAGQKGLYMALVPVWGSNVKDGGVAVDEADTFGRWIANRYKDRNNIIWLNGGDIRGDDSIAVWNALGNALRETDPNNLITFHPRGRTSSTFWFHNEPWLDFNMSQSGHRRYDQDDTEWNFGEDNWRHVQQDLAFTPLRPTIDGEPSYEGIPQGLHNPKEPYWNDADLRRYAYWSVFAGAFGFTYGNNAVMQFYKPNDGTPAFGAREYWDEGMHAPGAAQMVHLKKLMLSLPYFERIPDQSLIAGDEGEKYNRLLATRGENYALVYTYNGRQMDINMGKITGDKVKATWFDPRTGEETIIGEFDNQGIQSFDPPGEQIDGNDWVLILDSI